MAYSGALRAGTAKCLRHRGQHRLCGPRWGRSGRALQELVLRGTLGPQVGPLVVGPSLHPPNLLGRQGTGRASASP
eukprot:4292657-Pyramimonas_sp.AAC.1